MLRAIFGVSVLALLGGCATFPIAQKAAPIAHAPKKTVKHPEPCPCNTTANQAVQKRWYDGFKVRWLH